MKNTARKWKVSLYSIDGDDNQESLLASVQVEASGPGEALHKGRRRLRKDTPDGMCRWVAE